MSHSDVFHPRSVTKMHHPPCCSLSTPSIQSFSMPISASCVLLPSDLMTTPSLHHLSPPSQLSTSFSLIRFLLSFHIPYKHTTLLLISLQLFQPLLHFHSQALILSFPCLFYPFSHPTPRFSASLHGVLQEKGWQCQCQAIPSNDNVYYPLCLPLPMD